MQTFHPMQFITVIKHTKENNKHRPEHGTSLEDCTSFISIFPLRNVSLLFSSKAETFPKHHALKIYKTNVFLCSLTLIKQHKLQAIKEKRQRKYLDLELAD
jgi:hypothetical protein